MKSYLDQLKDPRWQKKRLELFSRAGFRCENCGFSEEQLHAHHRIYRKGKMLWEYPNEEYLVLCRSCHSRVSEKLKVIQERISLLSLDGIAALASILDGVCCHYCENWESWLRWTALEEPWKRQDIETAIQLVANYRNGFRARTGHWPEELDRDGTFAAQLANGLIPSE